MNVRKNIMILAKGEPITSRVTNCAYNPQTHRWNVRFQSGQVFSYAEHNVELLTDPVSLDPRCYHISYKESKESCLNNITSIFLFSGVNGKYWHICFATGCENDYKDKDLIIEKSCLENDNASHIFSYLREISENISVTTETGTTILKKQYETIDFLSEKSALAVYLNPEKYCADTGLRAMPLIFPFGCNNSQWHAVEQAILKRVSMIEGPPGTGKTQTILNIIANLLIRGKTVQVVSNNNSAIENIIEKLSSEKYELDFFVAALGRTEKKHAFIEAQTGKYPDFSKWVVEQNGKRVGETDVRQSAEKLKTLYEKQIRLAVLQKELQAIEIEHKHYLAVVHGMETDGMALHKRLTSDAILRLCQELGLYLDGERKIGFFSKLRLFFVYGIPFSTLNCNDFTSYVQRLQLLFYQKRKDEIHKEIEQLQQVLKDADADRLNQRYTEESLCYFRKFLWEKYGNKRIRKVFNEKDITLNVREFLDEYPVVLCTTYTTRSSLGKEARFDYVIMDEASQVDVATGALAMSCACNAVIVGDSKQLPNVVTKQQREQLDRNFYSYRIPEAYNYVKYSFLESFYELLGKRMPKTTLCEHYRCDPQIIGYCNHKFYHGELIVMSESNPEALKLVTTVAGNHVREHANLRQAEVIKYEVLPKITCSRGEIGIISPYRSQVMLLKKIIDDPQIEIDTVHKFQGREKNTIIFCTTDDLVTEFSDNPNLLNVAVSRAKKQLIIVASEMEQPIGSNVGDLIGYVRYHNCLETHSSISSVFDYLYAQNEEKRLEFLKKHRRISEYDSENLFYALIEDELKRQEASLGVICHQPLYLLFRDLNGLNSEEKNFIETGMSHLDFLIYNTVTKQPLLAIEVDGYNYHKLNSMQGKRDRLKDHILQLYHLPMIRFKTNGSGERQILQNALTAVLST